MNFNMESQGKSIFIKNAWSIRLFQVQYNLMPPSHFQAVQGVQHVQAVQTVQDPLMDPAIMSFSKPPQLPNINQVPTQYTQVQEPPPSPACLFRNRFSPEYAHNFNFFSDLYYRL